jgi:hypothetical protein
MFDGANLVLTAALLLSIPLLGTCMVLAARIPGRGKVGVIAFLIIQAILAGYGVVARFVVVSLQSWVPEAMFLLNVSTSGLRIVGWVMLAWGLYELGLSTAPKRQDSEAEFWHR